MILFGLSSRRLRWIRLSELLLIVMGGVRFRNVNARLRALGWQRALGALGSFVGFRVRRVGHRLMLMRTAIDL